jgi:site-specific DNA-methyltransferase (adenine-specific)
MIVHADCLETLKKLEPKSHDAIVTDPPYSARTHDTLGTEQRNDGGKERGEIDFRPLTVFEVFSAAEQFCRISRSWIIIFCDEFSLVTWATALKIFGGEYVRHGSWVKTDAMPQMSGDRPGQGTEEIVIAHAPREKGSGHMKWNGGGKPAVYRGPTQDRDGERMHRTQKPLWLMEAILRDFTNRGQFVLDPFAGAGTTGVACKRMGRHFLGYELDAKHYGSAKARIDLAREQFALFDT